MRPRRGSLGFGALATSPISGPHSRLFWSVSLIEEAVAADEPSVASVAGGAETAAASDLVTATFLPGILTGTLRETAGAGDRVTASFSMTGVAKITGAAVVETAHTAVAKIAGAALVDTAHTAVMKIAGAAILEYYEGAGPQGEPPVRFPPDYGEFGRPFHAWPFTKRVEFGGRVQRSIAGSEARALDQGWPVWTWVLTFPVLRDRNDSRAAARWEYDELRTLLDFFLARVGPAGIFAFDDVTDNRITGQVLATGDGSTKIYQAVRSMGGFAEPIIFLREVTALCYDGVPTYPFGWDITTGLITAAAPAPLGAVVTADFTYYHRVRFTDDLQDFENLMVDLWQLGECKIQSVPYR